MARETNPLLLHGMVVSGFGRGSKELGFPTANLEKSAFAKLPDDVLGVYYGYAQVEDESPQQMVMSLGWNPFFQNQEKSVEVHILKHYPNDFYGSSLKVIAIGFIRTMTSFDSLESLINAIENDIRIAKEELSKPGKLDWINNPFWTKCKSQL